MSKVGEALQISPGNIHGSFHTSVFWLILYHRCCLFPRNIPTQEHAIRNDTKKKKFQVNVAGTTRGGAGHWHSSSAHHR